MKFKKTGKYSFDLAIIITFLLFLYHNFYNFEAHPFWEEFYITRSINGSNTAISGGVRYSIVNVIKFVLIWFFILIVFFYMLFSLVEYIKNVFLETNKLRINAYQFTKNTWVTNDGKINYRFLKDNTLLRIKDNIPQKGTWQYFDKDKSTIIISIDEEKGLLSRSSDESFIDNTSNKTLYKSK